MSTRPRHTPRPPGHDPAPAPVAVPTTAAAGAVRAATPETVPPTLSVAESPGPVVGSVCTGYGGLDLGVLAALGGGRIAWCADPDPHIAQVLAQRMPGVANLGDVRAIDWMQVAPVEVLTAGFPCQDISAAGRRVGIEKGERSGLWTDIVGGLRVLRPALLVVENVAALRWRNGGLHRVLGDLAEAGYDALWRSVRAADIGAAHRRERVFLLAWPRPRAADARGGDAADADRARRLLQRHLRSQPTRRSLAAGPTAAAAHANGLGREELHPQDSKWWAIAARRGPAAADAEGVGHRHGGTPSGGGVPAAAVATGAPASGPRGVPADTAGNRRDERLPSAAGLQGRPDAALGGHAAAHPGSGRRNLVAVADPADQQPAESASARREVDWGDYSLAVRRWERVLGRPAPFPTQPGRHGRPVLAPAFVEWLQGLEPGWVTGLALPRTALLRACGNGVVPQQAAYAVGLLLADLAVLLGTAPCRLRRAPRTRPGGERRMTSPTSLPDTGQALRCPSLGAGVQSSTVLLLACEGVIPRFDVALFADTGWEPKAVYENLARLRAHAEKFGIPVRTVSAGNIRDDALDPAHRFVSMPLHVLNPDGTRGLARRQCLVNCTIFPSLIMTLLIVIKECGVDLRQQLMEGCAPLPPVGSVVKVPRSHPPFVVLDGDDGEVEVVTEFLRDLALGDASPLTCRSYAYDLLRWFRLLWTLAVAWDRATEAEVAVMVGWLRTAANPQRTRRTASSSAPGTVNLRTGKPMLSAGYARSSINHALSAVSGFYEYHCHYGRGPVVNPVPSSPQRRRALAHRSPLETKPVVGRARLRQKVVDRAPRAIPDRLWDALFEAMGCERDRAALEFFVSSGARAAELLGVTPEDIDWAGRRIFVVSKGTRKREPIPASPQAFVRLARYFDEIGTPKPGESIWRTRRGADRPLSYWALRRVLQRANSYLGTNWTLHDMRHTAATRMANSDRLTLVEVQTILRHADIQTTGRYLTVGVEELFDKLAEHYARPRTEATYAPGYDTADIEAVFGA